MSLLFWSTRSSRNPPPRTRITDFFSQLRASDAIWQDWRQRTGVVRHRSVPLSDGRAAGLRREMMMLITRCSMISSLSSPIQPML